MKLGGRSPGKVVRAVFAYQHYVAAINMFRLYARPADMWRRYLFAAGKYPVDVEVVTPSGPIQLTLYSYHDVLTLNEIFCRGDYHSSAKDEIYVDFGSNIGLSAAYFLTRNPRSRAYLYEPLPRNLERMRHNLAPFDGRYVASDAAVALSAGFVQFGFEDSGRYGGIGANTGQQMRVRCLNAYEELDEILSRHGRIDVLKIDVETLEYDLVAHLPPAIARRVGHIFAEVGFSTNPLPQTHRYSQYGSVARFSQLT